ncbi:multidrug effflux MFS transporter [Pleionea sediminis]|uniref:multidrug effflux MFS transporter n=1 Tax=Pleionea sediminis TaxID=2569479 RepID=UPI00118489FE|nr:multidrug effflux MFS transporter [Pleionea sediminis]
MRLKSAFSFLPLFASIYAITPLAVDMYLPAMPQMADSFSTGISEVQWSLSIFLAGYALGMLCFGPMADHYGRKVFLLGGLSGFLVTTLALAFAPDIQTFITLRFFQALFGGAATVVVPGTIRDLFGKSTAKGMSYVSMAMMIAPMLAPTIGSIILAWSEWQAIFMILTSYAALILFFAIFRFPFLPARSQSHSNVIYSVFRSYRIVLLNTSCLPFLLTTMLTTFVFFTYITSVSFVYITIYGVSEQVFGILFGANVAALMLGNLINARLVNRFSPIQMLRMGLLSASIVTLFLTWILIHQASIAYLIVSIFALMASLIIVSTNSDALVLISFPRQSGTATAVIGSLKFGGGAFSGLILSWLYDGSAAPVALVIGSAVTIIILLHLAIRLFKLPIPGTN